MAKLHKQFTDTGAEFVIIWGDTLEKAKRHVDIPKLPFPVLSDSDLEVYSRYELEKFFYLIQRTASVVVDRDGVVKYLKRTTNPNTWLQESRELFGFVDSMNEEQ